MNHTQRSVFKRCGTRATPQQWTPELVVQRAAWFRRTPEPRSTDGEACWVGVV